MPTTPTDAELLDLVKQALSGTLSRKAQQATIAGHTITSLSITDLIALRKDLETRVALAAGKGQAAVIEFREPS